MPNNTIKEIKQLSVETAAKAMALRDELLLFLDQNGIQYAGGNQAKPFTGKLSPGCRICLNGTWSCLLINCLCTRHCFFCPQNRSIKKERLPYTEKHLCFYSAAEYIQYLERFHFEGIGFSGGEPFMVFDRLLEFIRAIRNRFGRRHYIWVYSNGDLVTEEKLDLLAKAGLDEIRFDIAANQYDTTPVTLATERIKTVTVEIPAIPEDLALTKTMLKELESAGVENLNIHQIIATDHNLNAFFERDYTITNVKHYKKYFPVVESELAALELMKHAIETHSQVGINYCSRNYKSRFQGRGFRKRYAPIFKERTDSLTETFYVRTLSIEGENVSTNPLWATLSREEKDACDLSDNGHITTLVFPARFLPRMTTQEDYRKIIVTYHTPNIKPAAEVTGDNRSILDFGTSKISAVKSLSLLIELQNRISAIMFQNLFIEQRNFDETASQILKTYDLEEKERTNILADIKVFHGQFEDVEYIPNLMPKYD